MPDAARNPKALNDASDVIPTRASLLLRIKDVSQDASWREFFETYWKLIYNTARSKGLSDAEAQEVVQETMIAVSRNIPDFEYDPAKGAFKGWLRNLTYWKIQDQLRKRRPDMPLSEGLDVPDDREFTVHWDEEWGKNAVSAAIDRVKFSFSPKNFQIYNFCETQKKGPRETARVLRVSRARVYLVVHRIKKAIAREVRRLEETTEPPKK